MGVASVSHHGFAACENGPMTSGVERDEYIGQLRAAGWSAIEIAEEVGLSRSQVHRILATVGDAARGDLDTAADWADDADGAGELALDATEDYVAVAPFEFVGIGDRDEERFLDANGRSCSMLDVYRADYADGSVPRGYLDTAQRQRASRLPTGRHRGRPLALGAGLGPAGLRMGHPRSTSPANTVLWASGTYVALARGIRDPKICSYLHRRWCAILGLNQVPHQRSRSGCELRSAFFTPSGISAYKPFRAAALRVSVPAAVT
jgi:hypothetical protein